MNDMEAKGFFSILGMLLISLAVGGWFGWPAGCAVFGVYCIMVWLF